MKRKLFLSSLCLTLFSISLNAQRTWDMGNNTTLWPLNSPSFSTGSVVVDGLTEYSGNTFGQTGASVLTWADGYTSVQEFRSSGSSAGAATKMPTTRYFSFPVTGPTTVKVWFRVNGTGGRKCQISDGTNLLGELTDEDNTKPLLLSVNYTGGAGTIYVYSTASINYYKIVSTDAVLGTDDFKTESASNVYSNGSQVYVSNVKSKTTVSVYSIGGALIKTLETAEDTAFGLETGVWIVKIKSAQGEKSVKLLVK